MKIIGPESYKLSYTPDMFSVRCGMGTPNFSGIGTSKLPKLYVVAIEGKPVYVGMTKQPMRNRLNFGWRAAGESGYYGYAWRREGSEATLDLWAQTDATDRNCLDLETVEAEVVYLIRQAGQWPAFQTEIHFHASNEIHRQVAAAVFARYRG